MKTLKHTALLLIGMQNDYFSKRSPLAKDFEDPSRIQKIKRRILWIISHASRSNIFIANLPILFQTGHPEIARELGILASIKKHNLFQKGTSGSGVIPELGPWQKYMTTMPGQTGFNAFVDTGLHEHLSRTRTRQLVLAGSSTATCIDSTARSAYELGYEVIILDDCTVGRTIDEQDLYCQSIFPLYKTVINSKILLAALANENQVIAGHDMVKHSPGITAIAC